MVIYHIDMFILDIDMRYCLMIWEMTVSIRTSPITIWDILSLCPAGRLMSPLVSLMVVKPSLGAYTRPLFGSTSALSAG
jgi:hypothetical protein